MHSQNYFFSLASSGVKILHLCDDIAPICVLKHLIMQLTSNYTLIKPSLSTCFQTCVLDYQCCWTDRTCHNVRRLQSYVTSTPQAITIHLHDSIQFILLRSIHGNHYHQLCTILPPSTLPLPLVYTASSSSDSPSNLYIHLHFLATLLGVSHPPQLSQQPKSVSHAAVE